MEENVQKQIGLWTRAAVGWNEMRHLKVARWGDNMREVAVTEGDKVEAQIRLGVSVNGFGVGDLVQFVDAVAESDINRLVDEILQKYHVVASLKKGGQDHESLKESARIELGMRAFLEEGGFKAFTTTFEDLQGLVQLPGFAVQRLMADGYGFGAEGDWKTSALLRSMKVMAAGLKGGTSFMEDYTYHLYPGNAKVLGAHMLEVCESIAMETPRVEIHKLGIGGKADPIRSTFTVVPGNALNASLIDMGNRFRLIVNEVEVVNLDKPMPKLPVASALWVPKPNLGIAAGAWILAGGAHHTSFSQALPAECLEDFSEMADIEYLLINDSQYGFKKNSACKSSNRYFCKYIAYQCNDRKCRTCIFIVTFRQEFGHREYFAMRIERNKNPTEDKNHPTLHFPMRHCHSTLSACTGQTDQMFRANVGGKNGSSNCQPCFASS